MDEPTKIGSRPDNPKASAIILHTVSGRPTDQEKYQRFMYSILHSASSVWALVCCFLLALPARGQHKYLLIDKVAATVGGEVVLLSEVQEQVAYARQQNPKLGPDYACVVLQNLLVQKLLVHQAKIDSVLVKDEEVENQLDARIERLRSYFNQDDKAIEEYYGQTITQIKDQMREDMRNQMLAERMQQEITKKITITPAEVRDFFNQIPPDSLPFFNAEVEIRELVYKPPVNAEEKARAQAQAEQLRRRIVEKGESFAELAKRYSDDPGSAAQGGDLGWQKRGSFVPEFEAAVYKLEPGQVSPVVETEFGFHIIQLIERRGNLVHARHILIKPEITEDDLQKAVAKLDSIRNLILEGKLTFSEAVKTYGDKNTASYNNDGRVANPRTGNTFFEVGDLDTNIFFAIDELKVGDISKPTPFRAPDGSRYYRLILLESRSKPHKADLRQDYNKIQAAALEQKKNHYIEQWMLKRLRRTHVTIDPIFQHCPNLQEIISLAQHQR
ncbi:MAG: peptidylprolyl isomerase [Saprospiraceae bacterium]|nr:peptidylprolyl isomerase [Saprospiraceae bacterium]MDW8484148.1 peptidylprolyl isomerase [Saprospiraceae bacterium]